MVYFVSKIYYKTFESRAAFEAVKDSVIVALYKNKGDKNNCKN